MKKLLYAVPVMLLAAHASVFAGGGNEEAGVGEVTVWGWRTQDRPVWDAVSETLSSRGVTIEYQAFTPTEYDAKLQVSLQGGGASDMFLTRRLPGDRTQSLIDNEYIIPLDADVDFGNFSDSTMNSITSGGNIYGVPFAVQVVGIFYNKDIFAEYDIDEPRTWSELVSIAETLEAEGITPFFMSGKDAWTLAMQNAMSGVNIPGEAWIKDVLEGKTTFDDPAYHDLNTRLMDLSRYYQPNFMANTADELTAAFALGQAAMVFYGVWGETSYRELNPDFNYGFFPVPPVDRSAEPKVYVYMDGAYAINSKSSNTEESLEVIRYTTTTDYGTLFSEITGEITAMNGARLPDNEILQICYEYAQNSAAVYTYWVGSPFQAGSPTPYNILSEYMQTMYLGDVPPETVGMKINEALSSWFEPIR